MPQLQMEMFNRLYKSSDYGLDCKPSAVAACTLHLFLWDSAQMKELFYLRNPYLSLVLSFIFLSLLYFIAVYLVLQGFGRWDPERQRPRERKREEKKGRESGVFTIELHGNMRLLVPVGEAIGLHLEVCTYRQTCSYSHCEICTTAIKDKWEHMNCKPKSYRSKGSVAIFK